MENNILYSTFDNVTDSKRAGVELVGRNKLFKVLDLTTTVNLYYYNMSGFDYKYNDNQNFYYKGTSDFTWDARIIANIMLPLGISLQATGNYTAEQKNAQGKNYEMYWLDAGLRKSFLDRKLSVAITGRDLLNSRKMKKIGRAHV